MKKSTIISIVIVLLIFGAIGYALEMNSRSGNISNNHNDRRRSEIAKAIKKEYENDGFSNWSFSIAENYTQNKVQFVITRASSIDRYLHRENVVERDEFEVELIQGYYDLENKRLILDEETDGVKDLRWTIISSKEEQIYGGYISEKEGSGEYHSYLLYKGVPDGYIGKNGMKSIHVDDEFRDGVYGVQWLNKETEKENIKLNCELEYIINLNRKKEDMTIPKLRVSYLLCDEYREYTYDLELD